MLRTIDSAPIPVIAAVNGPAIGAGTQLSLASDLRVADSKARFAIPVAKLVFNGDDAYDEPTAAQNEAQYECWHSEDVKEARAARWEKRTPVFRGI